jgi:3-oxoacyl-[acyl-carrier protein] reductase
MNILVTGGASGLGETITKTLAADPSHSVYFTYCSSEKNAKEIESQFPNAKGVKLDFTNKEETKEFAGLMASWNIDVLVNNAMSGNIHKEYFHKSDETVFLNGFTNNILPLIKITQQAISVFRKKKFGKIITILSSAIINKPPVGWSEYVAGKAYIASLAKSWATENAVFNITSNCISPAFMKTRLTSDTDERIMEEMTGKHPLKKLLSTQEVADSVVYFLNASQQVNGVNLVINAASDFS